ncbi:MAG: DMT family transporter [Halopseudomonas sp.]
MPSSPPTRSNLQTLLLTGLALIAFAANSVLCRLALSSEQGAADIDAASFTLIRLCSGALTLMLLLQLRQQRRNQTRATPQQSKTQHGSWRAALYLFGYAVAFSYAYNSLDTGTGALILFGAVQLTIITLTLIAGTRPHSSEWLGLGLAFAGFVYLVLPNLSTPSLLGFVLMTLAGIAWGGYTLKGKGSRDPLADTAFNFSRTLPLALVLLLVSLLQGQLTATGVILAIASGALASGIGYSIWYRALAGLSATQAAVVQLLVPIIAAAGGVVFVDEPLSMRLLIASLMILGGIGLTVLGRFIQNRRATQPTRNANRG